MVLGACADRGVSTVPRIEISPLQDFPDVRPGDDLAALIAGGLKRQSIDIKSGDVVVVAQKIVSKAEDRKVDIDTMKPSARAHELAAATGKDAKLVELILSESTDVIRTG